MLKILPPRNRILLVLGALVMLSPPIRAQTVDEILSKNAQAHGGLEKMKSVTSMKLTGRIQNDRTLCASI